MTVSRSVSLSEGLPGTETVNMLLGKQLSIFGILLFGLTIISGSLVRKSRAPRPQWTVNNSENSNSVIFSLSDPGKNYFIHHHLNHHCVLCEP